MSAPTERRFDEAARIAALNRYAILDTSPEADFDDIVKVAAQICGVPMALISLVDADRQWFKAAVGIDAPETPRDIAFCAHAIQQYGLFTVTDAAHDERFAANPLVTGDPNLRFYVGAPLETPDGFPLGTLCVLDTQPRQLTEAQTFALEALSRQVVAQMELRRTLAEARRIEAERELLTLELTHRVKNSLAMVQAIVSQTLRTADSLAGADAAIGARLVTLSKAHDLLTASSWHAAALKDVVEAAVSTSGLNTDRFDRAGPPVDLGPRAALALALALHELITNATKYGALSNATGRAEVRWRLSPGGDDGEILTLEWRETGGPLVSPPTRSGFGTRLIQSALAGNMGGKSSLVYDPAGLQWTLEGPLKVMQQP
ncbi:MAG: GAF domain-containing protein [Alphaproteobacteria bacterium]|nr:GAF domain-containing protein [Alphaproteobacteria bacterium]MBU1516127.1 GAF domain-containing protein [Alphaproteobacteria bacterium]MBU2092658.1 GAF domain-containing protein [Alphaproteobacteria bacterium]MBU2151013.1 GAF domain-containing protein [Alphaproteobacteria bacterium]MBU2308445.1 GAF domain-containing protein [Alphaproteobacteria bacterium]